MYLAGLVPGASVYHLGTTFDDRLLQDLLAALRDPTTRQSRFGFAGFDGATFIGDAKFQRVTFTENAYFNRTTFTGDALFGGATFEGEAWFDGAKFAGAPPVATFEGDARFRGATFYGAAPLAGATFHGEAWFDGAWFAALSRFGPLVCARRVSLSGAAFDAPVTMEIAAPEVRCAGTRWASKATLRLRYAAVDLSDAVLSAPVAVTAHRVPFTLSVPWETMDESVVINNVPDAKVLIDSVRGVDAAHLVLTDTDLTSCQFTGAFHLDQMRLEGNTTFAGPPKRWRWTRRRVVAEEHHWRALVPDNPNPPRGWTPALNPAVVPGPNELASVYRALRKASEDAKNEPDAADFYYGEMEMRRHDSARPWGERVLLTAYWAVSGYGLRVSRALAALLVFMGLTVVLLMMVGLPAQPVVQRTTGTMTGGHVALATRAPVPRGAPPGPWVDRFSWRRADRSVRTAMNSVVFRSAGQGLTLPGTYIEMASRVVEPVLLALVLLALRSRVKR